MEHSERWGRVYPNSRAGEPWPRKGTGRTRWLQEVTDSAIDNTAECRTLMAIQAALWSPSAPDYDSMSDDCNALDQEYVVDDENRATRSRRRSREPRSSEEPSTRRALQPRAASPAAVQQLEPATAAADPPVNENDISAALFWEPCEHGALEGGQEGLMTVPDGFLEQQMGEADAGPAQPVEASVGVQGGAHEGPQGGRAQQGAPGGVKQQGAPGGVKQQGAQGGLAQAPMGGSELRIPAEQMRPPKVGVADQRMGGLEGGREEGGREEGGSIGACGWDAPEVIPPLSALEGGQVGQVGAPGGLRGGPRGGQEDLVDSSVESLDPPIKPPSKDKTSFLAAILAGELEAVPEGGSADELPRGVRGVSEPRVSAGARSAKGVNGCANDAANSEVQTDSEGANVKLKSKPLARKRKSLDDRSEDDLLIPPPPIAHAAVDCANSGAHSGEAAVSASAARRKSSGAPSGSAGLSSGAAAATAAVVHIAPPEAATVGAAAPASSPPSPAAAAAAGSDSHAATYIPPSRCIAAPTTAAAASALGSPRSCSGATTTVICIAAQQPKLPLMKAVEAAWKALAPSPRDNPTEVQKYIDCLGRNSFLEPVLLTHLRIVAGTDPSAVCVPPLHLAVYQSPKRFKQHVEDCSEKLAELMLNTELKARRPVMNEFAEKFRCDLRANAQKATRLKHSTTVTSISDASATESSTVTGTVTVEEQQRENEALAAMLKAGIVALRLSENSKHNASDAATEEPEVVVMSHEGTEAAEPKGEKVVERAAGSGGKQGADKLKAAGSGGVGSKGVAAPAGNGHVAARTAAVGTAAQAAKPPAAAAGAAAAAAAAPDPPATAAAAAAAAATAGAATAATVAGTRLGLASKWKRGTARQAKPTTRNVPRMAKDVCNNPHRFAMYVTACSDRLTTIMLDTRKKERSAAAAEFVAVFRKRLQKNQVTESVDQTENEIVLELLQQSKDSLKSAEEAQEALANKEKTFSKAKESGKPAGADSTTSNKSFKVKLSDKPAPTPAAGDAAAGGGRRDGGVSEAQAVSEGGEGEVIVCTSSSSEDEFMVGELHNRKQDAQGVAQRSSGAAATAAVTEPSGAAPMDSNAAARAAAAAAAAAHTTDAAAGEFAATQTAIDVNAAASAAAAATAAKKPASPPQTGIPAVKSAAAAAVAAADTAERAAPPDTGTTLPASPPQPAAASAVAASPLPSGGVAPTAGAPQHPATTPPVSPPTAPEDTVHISKSEFQASLRVAPKPSPQMLFAKALKGVGRGLANVEGKGIQKNKKAAGKHAMRIKLSHALRSIISNRTSSHHCAVKHELMEVPTVKQTNSIKEPCMQHNDHAMHEVATRSSIADELPCIDDSLVDMHENHALHAGRNTVLDDDLKDEEYLPDESKGYVARGRRQSRGRKQSRVRAVQQRSQSRSKSRAPSARKSSVDTVSTTSTGAAQPAQDTAATAAGAAVAGEAATAAAVAAATAAPPAAAPAPRAAPAATNVLPHTSQHNSVIHATGVPKPAPPLEHVAHRIRSRLGEDSEHNRIHREYKMRKRTLVEDRSTGRRKKAHVSPPVGTPRAPPAPETFDEVMNIVNTAEQSQREQMAVQWSKQHTSTTRQFARVLMRGMNSTVGKLQRHALVLEEGSKQSKQAAHNIMANLGRHFQELSASKELQLATIQALSQMHGMFDSILKSATSDGITAAATTMRLREQIACIAEGGGGGGGGGGGRGFEAHGGGTQGGDKTKTTPAKKGVSAPVRAAMGVAAPVRAERGGAAGGTHTVNFAARPHAQGVARGGTTGGATRGGDQHAATEGGVPVVVMPPAGGVAAPQPQGQPRAFVTHPGVAVHNHSANFEVYPRHIPVPRVPTPPSGAAAAPQHAPQPLHSMQHGKPNSSANGVAASRGGGGRGRGRTHSEPGTAPRGGPHGVVSADAQAASQLLTYMQHAKHKGPAIYSRGQGQTRMGQLGQQQQHTTQEHHPQQPQQQQAHIPRFRRSDSDALFQQQHMQGMHDRAHIDNNMRKRASSSSVVHSGIPMFAHPVDPSRHGHGNATSEGLRTVTPLTGPASWGPDNVPEGVSKGVQNAPVNGNAVGSMQSFGQPQEQGTGRHTWGNTEMLQRLVEQQKSRVQATERALAALQADRLQQAQSALAASAAVQGQRMTTLQAAQQQQQQACSPTHRLLPRQVQQQELHTLQKCEQRRQKFLREKYQGRAAQQPNHPHHPNENASSQELPERASECITSNAI